MKKAIIIGGIILLIGIGVVLTALSQAGAIISQFQPELESHLGDTLGSNVSIESIDLSFFPSTSLNIKRLTLQDPSDSNRVLTVQKGVLKISLLSLLRGNLNIDALKLVKPRIQLRQLKNGMAIDGIPVKPKKSSAKGKKKKKQKNSDAETGEKKSSSLPGWLSVNLDRAAIKDGQFIFHPSQKSEEEGKSYLAKHVELSTSIALEGQTVSFTKTNFSTDISTKGEIAAEISEGSFHLDTGTLALESGSIEANLRGSPFGAITTNFSGIEATLPQQKAAFKSIQVELLGGTIDLSGAYQGQKQSGEIQLQANDITHNGESIAAKAKIAADKGTFKTKNATIQIADSAIQIEAAVKPFTATIPFKTKVKITKPLLIERLVKAAKPPKPVPLTGTLNKFSLDASGEIKPSVAKTFSGASSIELVEGEFTGGNIPMLVLQSLKDLPFLSKKIHEAVPEKYKGELEKKTTTIDLLQTTVEVKNEKLHTDALIFKSTLFSLQARGDIFLNGKLDLDTTLRFVPEFSLALVQKVKELENLLDDKDQLVIPLTLKGTTTAPVVLPDLEELMKLGAGEKLKEEAGKFLGKILGSDKEGTEDGKPSKNKKLVDDVGKIFGF